MQTGRRHSNSRKEELDQGDCFDAVASATAADAASPIEHIDSVINGCIQALLHTQRKMAKVDLSKVGIFDAAAEDGAADRTLW